MTGYEAYRRWRVACREAGVRAMPFHAIRHATATFLRMAGMERDLVAKLLGHRDARMTTHYTHGEGELREQASEIMNRALGG